MRKATVRGHQLTVKQAKFVRAYVESGNGTQAALEAYETTDARTAHAIASENLQKPAIQTAVRFALDHAGLTENRLAEILRYYLDLHKSQDPALKRLGLRALDMAYKLRGSYAPERYRLDVHAVLDQMTNEELETFAKTGEFPPWCSPPPPPVPAIACAPESVPPMVSVGGMRVAVCTVGPPEELG